MYTLLLPPLGICCPLSPGTKNVSQPFLVDIWEHRPGVSQLSLCSYHVPWNLLEAPPLSKEKRLSGLNLCSNLLKGLNPNYLNYGEWKSQTPSSNLSSVTAMVYFTLWHLMVNHEVRNQLGSCIFAHCDFTHPCSRHASTQHEKLSPGRYNQQFHRFSLIAGLWSRPGELGMKQKHSSLWFHLSWESYQKTASRDRNK